MKRISIILITGIILMITFAGCMGEKKTAAKSEQTPPSASQKEQVPAVTPDSNVYTPSSSIQATNVVLQTPVDKMSYSYGVEVAKGLKKQEIEINPDAMARGMKDALGEGKFLMGPEELRGFLTLFQSNARAKVVAARMNISQNNQKAGEEFLAKNKTREGVVTLDSGLQYKIIRAGNGPRPTDSNIALCYYKGTLVDGTEIDSTFSVNNEEGEPSPIMVAKTVPGFREALKLMQVGSKWQIVIPPNLGYGAQGTGNMVGPNATLIYDVELLAIR